MSTRSRLTGSRSAAKVGSGRLGRVRSLPLRAFALVACGSLAAFAGLATAACSSTASHGAPSLADGASPSSSTGRPETAPDGTPSTAPGALARYLAHLPAFPPAPDPNPLALSHGPGRAAWVTHIPTTQRVAFVTIDDGFTKWPEAPELLRAANVPVSMFLTVNAVKSNVAYFRSLQEAGALVEDHTLTHRDLRGMPYNGQRQEICGAADWLGSQYGRHPVLFRPPFGDKDDNTLRAAHDCGMKACFFWTETVDQGKVFYQTSDHHIKPGDIILMHFRDTFADDFLAALQAVKASGLTPALLENYIT